MSRPACRQPRPPRAARGYVPMNAAAPTLRVAEPDQAVRRSGRARRRVDHLQGGTFAALLGPNGAGKSTLFQLLTGLVRGRRRRGRGGRPFDAAARPPRRCATSAWCSSRSRSTSTCRCARNLLFHADLHGLPRADALVRIAQACRGARLGRRPRAPGARAVGRQPAQGRTGARAAAPPAAAADGRATVGLDPKSRRDLLAHRARRRDRARHAACCGPPTWSKKPLSADRVLVLHEGPAAGRRARRPRCARALGGDTLEDAFMRATATPVRGQTPARRPSDAALVRRHRFVACAARLRPSALRAGRGLRVEREGQRADDDRPEHARRHWHASPPASARATSQLTPDGKQLLVACGRVQRGRRDRPGHPQVGAPAAAG